MALRSSRSVRHFRSSLTKNFAVLVLATLVCAPAASNLAPPALAATSVPDISGNWSSNFGAVNLKMDGLDQAGNAVVSGGWSNGNNKNQFVYGRFDPRVRGGTLKIEYYIPSTALYGYAEFVLDANKTTFNGQYHEAGREGPWTMSRAAGTTAKMVSSLPTLTTGIPERSDSLKSVTGKWQSNFGNGIGIMELEGIGLGRSVQLKGKITLPDGHVTDITSGSFVRIQRPTLKLEYSSPTNKSKGTAEFRPDDFVGGKMMLGLYHEGGSTGSWILTRPVN